MFTIITCTNIYNVQCVALTLQRPYNFWSLQNFEDRQVKRVGWNSSVSIATGYGLDGLGIESRWGQDFPHLSRPALGPTQTPVQGVPGLSRG